MARAVRVQVDAVPAEELGMVAPDRVPVEEHGVRIPLDACGELKGR